MVLVLYVIIITMRGSALHDACLLAMMVTASALLLYGTSLAAGCAQTHPAGNPAQTPHSRHTVLEVQVLQGLSKNKPA